jgi:glycosyltransferase involved in cell wall biosynthesis
VADPIPNGFDAADFATGEAEGRDDGRFRIVHTGYLHTELGVRHRRSRRLRRVLRGGYRPDVDVLTRSHVYLLRALDRLRGRRPELAQSIEVQLAGVLSPLDRAFAARDGAVRLRGYLPHAETVALLRSADLLFLPMQNLPPGVRAGIVPGKTYEYIAAGPPVLAAVPEGDARDLLAEAGHARIVRPDDVRGMADTLELECERRLQGRPPAVARAEVVDRYERRRQTGAVAELLAEALRSGP